MVWGCYVVDQNTNDVLFKRLNGDLDFLAVTDLPACFVSLSLQLDASCRVAELGGSKGKGGPHEEEPDLSSDSTLGFPKTSVDSFMPQTQSLVLAGEGLLMGVNVVYSASVTLVVGCFCSKDVRRAETNKSEFYFLQAINLIHLCVCNFLVPTKIPNNEMQSTLRILQPLCDHLLSPYSVSRLPVSVSSSVAGFGFLCGGCVEVGGVE
eukprot:Platyproteum_vivax@DN10586_c0_g1_i1.p1